MSCPFPTVEQPDIVIKQNVDFNMGLLFTYKDGTPIDLSGYTLVSQIRDKVGGALLGEFVCTIINPTAGEAHMFMAQSDCEKLAFTSPAYYDVIGIDGVGSKDPLSPVAKVYLDKGVTR
jgi:hypothetical protein